MASKYVDFNVDTVYVRTNIQKTENDLYTYNELQMTYDEYAAYKDSLLIEDVEILKLELRKISKTIDIENSSYDEIQQYCIEKSKKNLEEHLSNNPILSTCHKEFEKLYSITKDKQTLLAQMIAITRLAIENNVEYQPSWNASGEECTYDWTLEELKQLSFEIENVVRPLISRQQKMEAKIKQSKTKEEILNININF